MLNLYKFFSVLLIIILITSSITGFLTEENLIPQIKTYIDIIQEFILISVSFFVVKFNKKVVGLIWLSIFFLMISLISFYNNPGNSSVIQYLNGLREFIPYILFPISYIGIFYSNQRDFLIKRMNQFLHVFLVIQIPVTLYQFFKYGAGDFVGGTLGFGFSGILTFVIFLSTFYLMMQGFNKASKFKSFQNKAYLLIYWLPVFINETKISFFLILLFVILVTGFSFSRVWNNLFLGAILFIVAISFNSIYKTSTGTDYFGEIFNSEYLEKYFLSDNEKLREVPRFQKLVLICSIFDSEEIFLGKGVGQFKGGSTLDSTQFAIKFDWLLKGSRPMIFFLFVQLGLFGVVFFVLFWIFLKSVKFENELKVDNASQLTLFCTMVFLIILLYNDSFRSFLFCGIIMYVISFAATPVKIHPVKSLTTY